MEVASMKPRQEKILALSLLALVLIANCAGLWPELSISRIDLNDNVMHYPLVADMVETIERGGNPFDGWSPEWVLGYPVMRTYQPLGHFIVALIYFALFKSVSLMTVFVWVRFLSVALLPLTFYFTARLLSLSRLTAAAAAMLAPFISTPGLYGIEYGSYLWAGSGLFTQSIAMHFALLAIGFGYNAIRRGRLLAWTGMLLGLTFLAHFIYGYIAALTVCLLAIMPDSESRLVRIGRTVWVGAIALAVAAFELVPLMLDGAIINHSRWENPWKWDSFGAGQVVKWMFSGDLLDHGRLPILSALALAGVAFFFRDRVTKQMKYPARTFVLLGAALWILMFFGRPFWGPALLLAGVSPDMQLHRVVGGAHIFLIFVAAIGLAALWREMAKLHVAVAAIVTAALFFPMVKERGEYLVNNKKWGETNLTNYNHERPFIENAVNIAKERGGRAFAGIPLLWGGKFKVGDVPFYSLLSVARQPALSFMYHSMSLTSEVMTRFDESRPEEYRLFNIKTVIAPIGVLLPGFLSELAMTGPFRVMAAPGDGDFEVVDVFYSVKTTKFDFYDITDRWLQSRWVDQRQYLMLDLFGDADPSFPRLDPDAPLPASASFPFPGSVVSDAKDGETYRAQVDALRQSYVLFKMTWHPNWKATVDGEPVKTVMLSPGFVGIPVTAGRHTIECRYQPEMWKSLLMFGGIFFALMGIVGERRGWLANGDFTLTSRLRAISIPRESWVRTAVLLTVLALPVILPLLSTRLIEGHDATEYLPRQVEFHEDISHGILLPRWAPDLSNGAGQPLFLFNPPMIYYLAEIWRLLGFEYVTSLNLACVLIVLMSAVGIFLLGRLYFGELGGFLGAAAYLYAPYFSVDLFVRSAWAEFAAFPFFAFALYGFGAYAKHRKTRDLVIGASGYAGVLLSHNAAALVFAPVLCGFVALTAWLERSWKVLFMGAAGVALSLALAAFVWLPSLAMDHLTQVALVLEGRSNYTNHFVYLHQLFNNFWGYGFSLPGDQDGMSFSLGIGQVALIAAAFVALFWHANRKWWPWLTFFAGVAAILCFLMLPSAQFIWDRVRLLQYLSFPWRILGPIAVVIAALIAALGGMIEKTQHRVMLFGAAMALLIVPNLSHMQAGHYRNIDSKSWTAQQIAQRGIEVTSFAEYRTMWMKDVPPYRLQAVTLVSGAGEVQQTRRSPLFWSGAIHAVSPVTAEMWLAYFPCWRVLVDGKEVAARPADKTGLLRFDVPPGEHRITVSWTRNGVMWVGDGLSALALCILIALTAPEQKRRAMQQPELAPIAHARN
jgi:Dolichyl-phosphate-mannose-protein mannosyltransferase